MSADSRSHQENVHWETVIYTSIRTSLKQPSVGHSPSGLGRRCAVGVGTARHGARGVVGREYDGVPLLPVGPDDEIVTAEHVKRLRDEE
jgi:hypothetical protein